MEQLNSEPDAATREAFIEAMQKCVEEAFAAVFGNDEFKIAQMRQLVPGSASAYFARPSVNDPHHLAYQMFCKGMMHQRVRKPLNA